MSQRSSALRGSHLPLLLLIVSSGGLGCGSEEFDDGAAEGGFDRPLVCEGPGPRFATHVLEVAYGPGQDHGRDAMPEIVLGPPKGAGCCAGSLDVVSLGNGGSIVIAFAGNGIVDGPGPDFVVFENAFEFGSAIFAELGTVSVSEDGEHWLTFPCDAVEPPFGHCAGHRPVFLHGDGDIESGGGDPFDLADVGLSAARFVRIVDRVDLDGATGVFDLDAVGIIHPACP